MKQGKYRLLSNRRIARDVFEMRLQGGAGDSCRPGQFVNVALDGFYLRRPISVCDERDGVLTLVYKTVGAGTEHMSALREGTELDILTGLGNGYDLSASGARPLLIGGGVGVPPLYMLARKLREGGKEPVVILGFNRADEIFYREAFEALGETFVATADGSVGVRGFVTDAMPLTGKTTYFYACGPMPMLKAVYGASVTDGEFSFEERMGCGFGACMGCSHKTKDGFKRVCREGPVFRKEEIVW